jgi:FAD/FMN-containing dehydrogenase
LLATGATKCVGVLGPSLGGGHGRYNGLYGLVMDNILHYNVVLANGTEIGVNETSHSDLLWALKGAGHNFAAVTSIVKKIYPRQVDTWHFHNYTWTQDKLETVFEKLNKFHKSYNGTTPPKMGVNYGSIIMDRSISKTEVSGFFTLDSRLLLTTSRRY